MSTAAVMVDVGLYLALRVFGVQTPFYGSEVKEDFPVAAGEASAEEAVRQNEPGSPLLVSGERFHAGAHEDMGDALAYRREDGSHALRLGELGIFNGPTPDVYVFAAPDTDDAVTVLSARFANVGRPKANRGNQTYELPAEFDPEVHHSISVWYNRFPVDVAAVPLSRSRSRKKGRACGDHTLAGQASHGARRAGRADGGCPAREWHGHLEPGRRPAPSTGSASRGPWNARRSPRSRKARPCSRQRRQE